MTPADLQEEIESARVRVARNALAMPGVYLEYREMIQREGELEVARLRYLGALRTWVELTAPANQHPLEGV